VETPLYPHILAPGKLKIGVFKNIPLGKCPSTFIVTPPVIDLVNIREVTYRGGPLSATQGRCVTIPGGNPYFAIILGDSHCCTTRAYSF
jgi:hypothetical protein